MATHPVLKGVVMPIYEFKCIECDEYIEILVMGNSDEKMAMKCAKCGSENLERIMSSTNFSVAGGGGCKSAPAIQERTCSGGSCTTWNLPGHSS
jgi:putative FmdB family regulatory protein